MLLEDKVFVITSIRWKQLEKLVLKDPDYKKIKQEKICSYYWIDNDKGYEANAKNIHRLIDADPLGSITMFQLCPILNGKRDLFSCARSKEKKKEMSYFKQDRFEITEQELQVFAANNHLNVNRFGDGLVLNFKNI